MRALHPAILGNPEPKGQGERRNLRNPSGKGGFPAGFEHPGPKPPGARGSVSPCPDKVALSRLPALGPGCSGLRSVPTVDGTVANPKPAASIRFRLVHPDP